MKNKVKEIIETIVRPSIQEHGGDIRIVQLENKTLTVELSGACSGCPAADTDTREFIENILKNENTGITSVKIHHPMDPQVIEFAKKILRHEVTV